MSDGTGGIEWVEPTYNTEALVAIEYVEQTPSAINIPFQITLGAPQANTGFFAVNSDGSVLCTRSGIYNGNLTLYFERSSSGGTAVLLTRLLINGTQAGTSIGIVLSTGSTTIPLQFELPSITLTSGDLLTFEIMRDSSGTDNGGLQGVSSAGGWGNTPSCALRMQFLQDV